MSFEIEKVKRSFRDFWIFEVDRLVWDVKNLFKRNDHGAFARKDITHAYVNVFVEGWRVLAYPVGHLLALFVAAAALGGVLQYINHLVVNL